MPGPLSQFASFKQGNTAVRYLSSLFNKHDRSLTCFLVFLYAYFHVIPRFYIHILLFPVNCETTVFLGTMSVTVLSITKDIFVYHAITIRWAISKTRNTGTASFRNTEHRNPKNSKFVKNSGKKYRGGENYCCNNYCVKHAFLIF